MPAGRPTKYTPELLAKCYEYIETWKDRGDMIPSHDGLILYLDISSTCFYDWAKQEDKKEFSEILDKILFMQRQELINKGLSSEFNSNICKLVLGKHGYHDRQTNEISGPNGSPIETKWTIEVIDANPSDTE